jgi:translocation and assembly module TamA
MQCWWRLCHAGTTLGQHALLFGVWVTFTLSCSVTMAAPPGISYEVAITGVPKGKLRTSVEEISSSVLLRKERPPLTLAMLHKRVGQDIPKLLKALKAEGYYAATVTSNIDANARPVKVIFRVDLGPAYLLKSVDIMTTREAIMPVPTLGLQLGEPTRAQAIIDAQAELLGVFKKRGFPFPKIVGREVVVDHSAQSVAVTYRLDPGPSARFGLTTITGLKSVHEELIRGKIPWQTDDRYDADLLQEIKKRLNATGLFAMVRVAHAKTLDEEGRLAVTISVLERRHRSIGAGIGYKTDEGPGAKVSWEHRNLFHGGERLLLSGAVSDFTRAGEGNFRKPGFWREDQSLRINMRIAKDEPDAYTSRNFKSSVLIDRHVTDALTLGGGLAFKTSKVVQLEDEERFDLVSLPLHCDWDTSSDLLDPTRGGRLAVQFAPYQDLVDTGLFFIKGMVTTSRYLAISPAPSLVLAGQIAVGAMTGAERDAIPADERFYAGGGGSIRGYPYQSVGPLEGDDPLGGRSVLELSMEVRWHVSEQLGLVTFLDGGTAFSGTGLDSSEKIRWGTGAGIRYFTPIGPVRLDIGVPLNRRSGVDDSFQLYVSLGQAF